VTAPANLDDLITDLTPDRPDALDRLDAYSVLLGLLDGGRAVADRTTAAELWKVLQTLPEWRRFGSRGRLHSLLTTAADDGEIRRTGSGVILLRSDAPLDGGPEHVWVRLDGRGGAEVEVTGADPWPTGQLHAPGPAWWLCTGCRDNGGNLAAEFRKVRAAAAQHAATCRAATAPAATHQN
jgi:hypothetical protein